MIHRTETRMTDRSATARKQRSTKGTNKKYSSSSKAFVQIRSIFGGKKDQPHQLSAAGAHHRGEHKRRKGQ